MTRKLKVYLCDFVHNYLGAGSYMFPLNIGYLKAFAVHHLGEAVDISLFKYPNKAIEAIKDNPPDVLGFSHYNWNANLNKNVAGLMKQIKPDTVIVFGGPNVDPNQEGTLKFFREFPEADFFVANQGESPFKVLLEKIMSVPLPQLKNAPIDGVIFWDNGNDSYVEGSQLSRIKHPDEIPSPYLTGILDEFFEDKLIPIIETNRGCPFRCTFCAQGLSSFNQVNFFTLERVKDELKYAAQHTKNTNMLTFADANFGIRPRDLEIAHYIKELQDTYGFPRKCNMNWAKNQPKILEIAKILKQDSSMIISLQSLDDEVLNNVKRKNIKLAVFQDIIQEVNESGGVTGTEIIVGLPGESVTSHMETLRKVFDWGVSYITCYNGLVLEGTELSMDREKHQLQTKFRLIDSSFGKYDEDLYSLEWEEGIMANDAMTQEELLSFRPVHWLIQFLWNYRFYFGLLKFLHSLGVNPIDFIVYLTKQYEFAPEGTRGIFEEFKEEAYWEWHDSPEALRDYFRKEENFAKLAGGAFGKMNGKYIWKVLDEDRLGFEKYLFDSAKLYDPALNEKISTIREIIDFHSVAILDLKEIINNHTIAEKHQQFHYDFIAWKKSHYDEPLENFHRPEGITYRFFLPETQRASIQVLLHQYAHENMNVTLRKMSEFMLISDLYYEVEHADGGVVYDQTIEFSEPQRVN